VNKRIQKSTLSSTNARIKRAPLGEESSVSFSFKYLEKNHGKFSYVNRKSDYFLTLLTKLSDYSSMKRLELLANRSPSIRCHPIEWKHTSEKGFGFKDEEQLVDTPYQLQLTSNRHGRIHGFFIEAVFYVVWLDPDHLLYPTR
jgi:hypothetical protein